MNLHSLPLGTIQECLTCGSPLELCEYTAVWPSGPKTLRYWSDCRCIGRAIDRDRELVLRSELLQTGQRTEVIADPVPIGQFTFETFDPTRLANGAQLIAIVCGWLEAIAGLPVAPSYNDKPRCCLYFYSPGKGRGKTHLAGAIVNQVRADGRRAVLVDEISYIESYWAADFEAKAKLSALPGERAWLTVIDDFGQRESIGPGLRDAWYDIVNPRWLKRGWLIVTSNWTPDELVERGTINAATYSRLVQMTHGKLMTFDGADQRLMTLE